MEIGRMTGRLALAVLIVGGVAALALHDLSDTGVVRAESLVAFVPETLPTDLPERPASLVENTEKALLYEPGRADEYELEQFWQSCQMIDPDDLEQLVSEIEFRVQFFESVYINRSSGQPTEAPPLDGAVTQDEFLAYYGRIGLDEARFLLEECVGGRMRKTPFHPIPPTTLDNSHELAQLVPHISPTLDSGFVARLDYLAKPGLFDERPIAYQIAKKVFQEGGAAAALHDQAAHAERTAAGR